MIVHSDLTHIPASFRKAVVAMGNFDGVHRGHQAVIGDAYLKAQRLGVQLIVLTFSPHPKLFFNPDAPPFIITPLRHKIPHFAALGVHGVLALNFADSKDLTAEQFIDTVLVQGLSASAVSIGYDFRFGAKRAGTVGMLQRDGRFEVLRASPQQDASGEVFSSTLIRQYLRDGMVAMAGAVMGHPFEIHGQVVQGKALGRKLGFATANIKFANHIIRPRYGVYAVRIAIENPDQNPHNTPLIWHDGICNIGVRPTVDGIKEVLEVHIFDFSDNIYDTMVRVAFIEHIRYEQRFENTDDLKVQIAQDCNVARRVHNLRLTKNIPLEEQKRKMVSDMITHFEKNGIQLKVEGAEENKRKENSGKKPEELTDFQLYLQKKRENRKELSRNLKRIWKKYKENMKSI